MVAVPAGCGLFSPGATTFAQPAQSPAVAEVRQTLDSARKDIRHLQVGWRVAGCRRPSRHQMGRDALGVPRAVSGHRCSRARRPPKPSGCCARRALGPRPRARRVGWVRRPCLGASWRRRSTTKASRERISRTPSRRSPGRRLDDEAVEQIGRAAGPRSRLSPARRQRRRDAIPRGGENRIARHAYAEEADGLLYEIKYLSAGLPAPAVSGQTRNAGRSTRPHYAGSRSCSSSGARLDGLHGGGSSTQSAAHAPTRTRWSLSGSVSTRASSRRTAPSRKRG